MFYVGVLPFIVWWCTYCSLFRVSVHWASALHYWWLFAVLRCHDVRLTVNESSAKVIRAAAPVVFCFDGDCCCCCWFDLLLLRLFCCCWLDFVGTLIFAFQRSSWISHCHQMDPFAALGAAAVARLLIFREATASRRQSFVLATFSTLAWSLIRFEGRVSAVALSCVLLMYTVA